MKDDLDQRNQLAADRTVLAAERTYAAWVQLGLAALAAGIGAKQLLEGLLPAWMIIGTASLLVFFSSFCFAAAYGGSYGQARLHRSRMLERCIQLFSWS